MPAIRLRLSPPSEYEGETMAPPTRTPRSEWIRQGLRALAEGGPDAVRIEPLAKELGVSRGGFYWHFEDRSALLAAMLDTWEQATTEEVAEHWRAKAAIPAKLRRLFTLTSPSVVKTDLAIRDWARRDHAVAERLRRIDNRRMGHLRALSRLVRHPAEVEARCLLTFSLLIGNHYITADHGSYSRTDVLEMALRQLAARGGPDAQLGPVYGYKGETGGRQVQDARGVLTGRCAWVVALPRAPLAGSRSRIPALDSHGMAAHSRAGGGTFLQYTRRCASDDGSHVRMAPRRAQGRNIRPRADAARRLARLPGRPPRRTLRHRNNEKRAEESHERTDEHDGPRDGWQADRKTDQRPAPLASPPS